MRWRNARGISLIEAVVALAVMAFGMLAYVGLQSTLRFNGDVAKQRAEAVRIAQEVIEQWRAYSLIEPDGDQTDYADIRTLDPVPIDDEESNAVFSLTRTVSDAAATPGAPRMKTLTVDVSWQDRNGETQSVRLSTTIAASPPELAGTLAVSASVGPLHQPLGRHPAIPPGADLRGDDKSIFMPPVPGGGALWVFDNLTGVIVGVCNTVESGQAQVTQADTQACIDNTTRVGLPLSGFVRFFTDPKQPLAPDAEHPTSLALGLDINLALTGGGLASPAYLCYTDAPTSALRTQITVAYFCAIFFQANVTAPNWSGTSMLSPVAFPDSLTPPDPPDRAWQLADDAADKRSSRYRVCRYTPAASDAQVIPNHLHPRTYVNVGASETLTNQNFLVIRAGDDVTTSFQCPIDAPADPASSDFVNSNTLLHQPPPPATP